jgi:RecJ-like exonuclease
VPASPVAQPAPQLTNAGFTKSGNNGVVSCSAFCKDKQYGGIVYQGCSSAYDRAAKREIPCSDVRGRGSAEVTCYCGGTGGAGGSAAGQIMWYA